MTSATTATTQTSKSRVVKNVTNKSYGAFNFTFVAAGSEINDVVDAN